MYKPTIGNLRAKSEYDIKSKFESRIFNKYHKINKKNMGSFKTLIEDLQ